MDITVTLIIQMLVFAIFIWVVMNFIWPIILGAMNEREKKIAAGLAAAEQGQKDLSEAKSRADEVIKEARVRAQTIESQAQARANQIIEEARKAASLEGEKALGLRQVADRPREQSCAGPAARPGGKPRRGRRQARARERDRREDARRTARSAGCEALGHG